VHVVPLSSTLRRYTTEIEIEPEPGNGLDIVSAAQSRTAAWQAGGVTVADDKAALRRRMRMVLDDIPDRTMRSVQLWAALAERPDYVGAHTVMAFVALRGEPDTDGLLARLERDGKRLLLPRVDGDQLVAAEWGDGLRRGAFSVWEPTGSVVHPAEIDVVVVPGLAFTNDGRRLGRGGGHYDRLLATVACPTFGVCFAEQLCDELPVEPHDVRVGAVLSC
jgi:5-formyltetrahydrofolate cyclo-ligase